MLDAFYNHFWYYLTLYLFHLVTIPSMSMFPFRFQVKRWQKYLIMFLAAVASGSCTWLLRGLLGILHTATGISASHFENQLSHLIFMVLFSMLLYKGKPYAIFLAATLALALSGQIVSVYGCNLLLFWRPEYTPGMIMVRDILGFSTLAVYYWVLRRFSNITSFYLKRRDHIIMAFIAVFHFWLGCFGLDRVHATEPKLLFFSACTAATMTITFLLFRFTDAYQQTLVQQAALRDLQMTENTLSQVQENASRIRATKHELKNHFTYIESLVEQERYDALKEYLTSMRDWNDKVAEIISTANPTLNAICNQKLSYANSLGIHTEASVMLPETLPLDDLTLCSILGNMLDNAIESCRSQEAPVLALRIYPIKAYLVFWVENSVTHDVLKENPHLLTTKEDAENHGNGMRILRQIAESHNGTLRYKMSAPDRFTVQVILEI